MIDVDGDGKISKTDMIETLAHLPVQKVIGALLNAPCLI